MSWLQTQTDSYRELQTYLKSQNFPTVLIQLLAEFTLDAFFYVKLPPEISMRWYQVIEEIECGCMFWKVHKIYSMAEGHLIVSWSWLRFSKKHKDEFSAHKFKSFLRNLIHTDQFSLEQLALGFAEFKPKMVITLENEEISLDNICFPF